MKIATWNVNGIRARCSVFLDWLIETKPDIVCLQEIKTEKESFPFEAFEKLNYYSLIHGEKGFNGVAILSKLPFIKKTNDNASPFSPSSRFLEGMFATKQGNLRVVSLYAPNGNPAFLDLLKAIHTPQFLSKIDWLEKLKEWIIRALPREDHFVLAGDYNIIPCALDAQNPREWINDALFQEEARRYFRLFLSYGLCDAVRCVTDSSDFYTFWDYRSGAWRKNNGIRIDHLLLSPRTADCLHSAWVDKDLRACEKPSDHVPVLVELDLDPA